LYATNGTAADHDLCAAFGLSCSNSQPGAVRQYLDLVQREAQCPRSPAYAAAAKRMLERLYVAFPEYSITDRERT